MSDTLDSLSKNKNLVPLSIIVAGVLVAGAILYTNSPRGVTSSATPSGPQLQPTMAATAPTQKPVNIKDVKVDGQPFIGQVNAPVTIAYWSDYQCPFCKSFELNTLPTIVSKYVDTGKVKVVFKEFPFLGQDSVTAAEYADAVWALYPSQFFAWREAMFKAQDQEGDQGFGNEDSIVKLSATIPGINANTLKANVATNKTKYDAASDADKTEGSNLGVSGTPAFILGTQMISGAQPLAIFTAAIDGLLNK